MLVEAAESLLDRYSPKVTLLLRNMLIVARLDAFALGTSPTGLVTRMKVDTGWTICTNTTLSSSTTLWVRLSSGIVRYDR